MFKKFLKNQSNAPTIKIGILLGLVAGAFIAFYVPLEGPLEALYHEIGKVLENTPLIGPSE